MKEIKIICTEEASEPILQVLKMFAHMGNLGSSRYVNIEGFKPKNILFDGDGEHKIREIIVDGEKYWKLPSKNPGVTCMKTQPRGGYNEKVS